METPWVWGDRKYGNARPQFLLVRFNIPSIGWLNEDYDIYFQVWTISHCILYSQCSHRVVMTTHLRYQWHAFWLAILFASKITSHQLAFSTGHSSLIDPYHIDMQAALLFEITLIGIHDLLMLWSEHCWSWEFIHHWRLLSLKAVLSYWNLCRSRTTLGILGTTFWTIYCFALNRVSRSMICVGYFVFT